MIPSVEYIGLGPEFTIFYVLMEVADQLGVFAAHIMIYNGLELESTGMVLAISSIVQSLFNASMTYVNGQVNSMFTLPGTATKNSHGKIVH